MIKKEIRTLEELVKWLNNRFGFGDDRSVVAVFDNNDSDEIIGWLVADVGVEGYYPVMTIEELFEKYDK